MFRFKWLLTIWKKPYGKLVQRLSNQLEPDRLALEVAFTNTPFLEENNFTEETISALFIPIPTSFIRDIAGRKKNLNRE